MAGSRKGFQGSADTKTTPVIRRRRQFAASMLAVAGTAVILIGVFGMSAASAAQPPVNLGTTSGFAVLAGSTVTNTGPSSISGDLGLYPGTAVTGFPPGKLTSGTVYVAPSGAAKQAQADLKTAYNDAAGRTPATVVTADLGGQTLAPGVYKASSSLGLTGTVTLDGQNNLGSVFVFEAGSTLITATSSTVRLINGAQACNVFWQVGSSATLGTTTTFVGSVLALTSATLDTGAVVDGRVLARNGAVTLDDNTITSPTCATAATTTTLKPTTTTTLKPTTTTLARSTTTTTRPRGSTTTTTSARRSTTTTTAPKRLAATTTTSGPSTTTTTAVRTTTTTVAHASTTTTVAGSVTTTTATGSVTTTTPLATTTTTAPGVPTTTIPGSHTGEPWAGWPYWALTGFAGLLGLAFVGREVLIRRRRA